MVILLIITRIPFITQSSATPQSFILTSFPFNFYRKLFHNVIFYYLGDFFLVSHLNLFTAIYRQKIVYFFFLFSYYLLSMAFIFQSAQSNYRLFQLAFRELNKRAVQRILTDRYKHMYHHSTHTCSELDESPIPRSSSCTNKELSQLILKNQSALLSANTALILPCCIGTSAGLHQGNMNFRSCIYEVFPLVSL